MARLLLLATGLAALVGCPSAEPPAPPDLPAIGGLVTLLRVPRQGGTVEAYASDSLSEPIWTSRASVPPVRRLLGVNLEARLLEVLDSSAKLTAIDLEARGTREQSANVRDAAFVPNGAVYALDNRRRVTRFDLATPTVYRDSLSGRPRFMAGTLGDHLVVAVDSGTSLEIFNAAGLLHSTPIPPGEIAATYWGDLIAVADGAGIGLFETGDPYEQSRVEVGHAVGALAFSPSGHRLYAAHDGPGIAVIDRYAKSEIANIDLRAQPSAVRTEWSGRWMLARYAQGDSAWVIDLTTNRVVSRVGTPWEEDLPTVAGAATLLTREGDDLAAYDLGKPGLPEVGRIEGGANDWWLVSTWQPRERARHVAQAAESVLVRQDSLLLTDSSTAAPARPTDALYLQVSSSQNPDWSRELARQLTGAGYPARVLDPNTADEGFRVVVGPYPTRPEAEEVGRQLGRPYFILSNPPISRR
ncbi:MAG: SPOR domain-containing protein [Gemmatimonadales bacterium]